ncbi:MAG: fibronectin type III domain-containing protein [Deltaproteobacteria bacterium]|nr:fibronectin type III domain-containing protein [Deltaproteobacteria bacterium]
MRKLTLFIVLLLLTGCAGMYHVKTHPVIETSVSIPPPKGIVAKGNARAVMLKWQPITGYEDIAGYRIFRSTIKDGDYTKAGETRGRYKTIYIDRGNAFKHLQDDTVYYYKIAAFNREGKLGYPSFPVSARTAPPPAIPQALTAMSHVCRKIPLSWTASGEKDVCGYIIYRGKSKNEPLEKLAKVRGRLNTSYIDENLPDNATYCYSISAYNKTGAVSKPSPVVCATTKKPPIGPHNLVAKRQGAGKIVLNWYPSTTPDVTSYEIYRGENKKTLSKIKEVSSACITFTDTGLTPGKTYFYKVRAKDADGLFSSFSNVAQAQVKPLPSPPKGISAVETAKGVLVKWKKSETPDVVKYILYRKSYLVFVKEIVETDKTDFMDTGVKRNTTYTYWVRAVDSTGQLSKDSPSISIKTGK